MRTTLTLLMIAVIAGPAAARGLPRLEAGLAVRHWESSDTTTLDVSQVALPFRLDLPLGSRFGLSVQANPGRTTIETEEIDSDLAAAGNVVVKASWYAIGQTLLLRTGASIPTASSRLKEEDFPIAAVVANDELGFAMDSPIDGLSATAGIAVARQWGDLTIAGGVGYSVRAPFQPYEGVEGELDPGEELVLTAGLHRRMAVGDEPALLKADVAVVLYGTDLWEDAPFRRLGPRADIRGLVTLSPGAFDPVEVSGWVRLRARGKIDGGGGLTEEGENSFGPEGACKLRMGYVMTPWLRAKLEGFARVKGDNGYGVGGGRVFGASVGPLVRLGRGMSLGLTGGFLAGRVGTGSTDTDMTGYEFGSSLAYTW